MGRSRLEKIEEVSDNTLLVEVRGPAKVLSRCVPKAGTIVGIKIGQRKIIAVTFDDGERIEIELAGPGCVEQLRHLLKG